MCLSWLYYSEAALQRCSWEKVLWKYAANLQRNTHVKVRSDMTEIALQHVCSPVNLLLIFRTPFPKNISGVLLLVIGLGFLLFLWKYLFILQIKFIAKDLFKFNSLKFIKFVREYGYIKRSTPPLFT